MTWATDSAKRDEGVAKALFERENKMLEHFGEQPIDTATGDPMKRANHGEKMTAHLLMTQDPERTLMAMVTESRTRGLSQSRPVPRKWFQDRMRLNRRAAMLREGLSFEDTEPSVMEEMSG